MKQVALTFDDGPDNFWTLQLLDELSHYNIKATFMCLGELAQQNPEVLKRIANDGHTIGNHTWDHPNLLLVPLPEVRQQIKRTTKAIQQIVGLRPYLFRPPYGYLNESITNEITSLDYQIVLWTINSDDYSGLTKSQVINNILSNISPGSIILQHCAVIGHNNSLNGTVQALPELIETLLEKSFNFVTVPELLRIPAYL